MVKTRIFAAIVCCFFLLSCASTHTSLKHYAPADRAVLRGDYPYAIGQINAQQKKAYKHKDRVLWYLDMGMLHHYNGDYEKSNHFLTLAENSIEELFTKSISKAGLSLLLNDNATEYSGEEYEDIYLNVFKALNYLHLGRFDNSFVEINRVNHKLNMLEDKNRKLDDSFNRSKDKKIDLKPLSLKFYNDALARYLSSLLYYTDNKYDDAQIDLNKVEEAFLNQSQIYDFSPPDFKKYLTPTKKVKVNILAFGGRSAVKTAKSLFIHTEKDVAFISTTKKSAVGDKELTYLDFFQWYGLEEGYHFKFQLPELKKRPSKIARVVVKDSTSTLGTLQLIEDVDNVAKYTYQTKYMRTYIKTITRTITKGILAKKASEEINSQLGGSHLTQRLVALGVSLGADATENADLRISRYFPKKAYVGQIELERGIHNLQVDYLDSSGKVLFSKNFHNYLAEKDRLNLIEVYYPR